MKKMQPKLKRFVCIGLIVAAAIWAVFAIRYILELGRYYQGAIAEGNRQN